MVSPKVICLTVLSLTACGIDPGDVAGFEQSRVEEAVPVGSDYKLTSSALGHLGYTCKKGSGQFKSETGNFVRASDFLQCHNPSASRDPCKISVSLVVLPNAGAVAKIYFMPDYVCQ
jgi:hypothetical protein